MGGSPAYGFGVGSKHQHPVRGGLGGVGGNIISSSGMNQNFNNASAMDYGSLGAATGGGGAVSGPNKYSSGNSLSTIPTIPVMKPQNPQGSQFSNIG